MVLALCPSPAGIRRPQAASIPAAATSSATRPHAARPAAAARRRLRAAAEKEGGATQQADGEQLRVPDTPPAPAGAGASSSSSSAQQQQSQASAASQLNQAETLSVEEIQRRAAALRQQKAGAEAKDGLLEGVREEVGLIKWPAPVKALVQTLLVTVIVAGTAAGLLAVNGLLNELNKLY
ncbi:pre translocase subunit SECE1 [Chlorella sorokiniana]|uniref:Pre translocase subunit SECE1 n=1 Tax=Chlorella sorokiniana TaxID=3076 RepID=A0A2P6TS32_CHLSO|nr:pre translocase subunit SECE1 [Chlorella sorokiniana]|eukprot:PRW56873.1 pre translocase subunit SECE1 [Chlorella sorokiniana]